MLKLSFQLFFLISLILVGCDQGIKGEYLEPISNEDFQYIGNSSCAACHEAEFHNWKNSDHDKAMDIATDSTVLGDFNEVILHFRGSESRMYKRDGKFYSYTEGPEGKMGEFEITHTFGHFPLQQYLVPFENGSFQCLPITWDSKQNKWYHMADSVYKDLEILPNDWLYWTNGGQNWNGMCAECHSTNLSKNYNPDTKSYSTTWSEIDVSCEACHGPASRHLDWAQNHEAEEWPYAGFMAKTTDLNTEETLSQCAYCHARRSSFSDYDNFGQHYLDQFAPQLINENFYHYDGQIKEEDYVFTSFTQTRMFARGVKCSDCHEPHNLRTKQQGNLLCLQCHDHRIYDTEKHHFHLKTGIGQSAEKSNNGLYEIGDGTQCVDCHMTGQKYMGVDFRRDHSFRVPNPLVSSIVGSPDACTQCHKEMTSEEADQKLKEWYPNSKERIDLASDFFHIANGHIESTKNLEETIGDTAIPQMMQASAIQYLSRTEAAFSPSIENALRDTNALLRYAAVRYYRNQSASELEKKMIFALQDEYKAIRIEAARTLLDMGYSPIDSASKATFDQAIKEFITHQKYGADFASSRHNLAIYYASNDSIEKAINYLKEAIRIDDHYYPAMLELAILYSRKNRNDLAQKWLIYTLEKDPENPSALSFMGLLLAEEKKYEEALVYLERSIEAYPNDSRNHYNASLISQELGHMGKAEDYLIAAIKIDPYNRDYLYALTYFYMQQGNKEKAKTVGHKMLEIYPDDPSVQSIVRTLKNG